MKAVVCGACAATLLVQPATSDAATTLDFGALVGSHTPVGTVGATVGVTYAKVLGVEVGAGRNAAGGLNVMVGARSWVPVSASHRIGGGVSLSRGRREDLVDPYDNEGTPNATRGRIWEGALAFNTELAWDIGNPFGFGIRPFIGISWLTHSSSCVVLPNAAYSWPGAVRERTPCPPQARTSQELYAGVTFRYSFEL